MEKPIRKDNISDALKYARVIADEVQNDPDEFIHNVLEIRRTTTADYEPISLEAYRTIGGPTCYLDTATSSIKCLWGADKASVHIKESISKEIESAFTW